MTVSAAALLTLWAEIPDQFVSHWNAQGRPDGWTQKGPALFVPVAAAVVGCAILELFAWLAGRAKGSQLTAESQRRMREANQECIRVASLATAGLLGYLSVAIPIGKAGPQAWPAWLFVAGAVVYPIARLLSLLHDLKAKGELPPGYGACVYKNADDPRLWVPKVGGFGSTLNFAHPGAIPALLLILSLPLAIVALVVLTRP